MDEKTLKAMNSLVENDIEFLFITKDGKSYINSYSADSSQDMIELLNQKINERGYL